MKHIHLLPDVVLIDRLTGKPWLGQDNRQTEPIVMSHKTFLRGRLCDLAFGRGSERIRSSIKLEKAIDEAVVYVSCEDADHVILLDTIRSPSAESPFIPNIAPSVFPFMEAVADAKSEVPEEWKGELSALEQEEAPQSAAENKSAEPEA